MGESVDNIDKLKRLIYIDWYETEDEMWMCLADKNAICKLDKKTLSVKIMAQYPDCPIDADHLSQSVIYNNNKLVFIPFAVDMIAIYDQSLNKCDFIPLAQNVEYCNVYFSKAKFWKGFSYKHYVFLLGFGYPAILRINLNTYHVDYIQGWVDEVQKYSISDDTSKGYIRDGMVWNNDNNVFLPLGMAPGMLNLNLETLETFYMALDIGINNIIGIKQQHDNIWMTDYDGHMSRLVRSNIDTHQSDIFDIKWQGIYYAPVIVEDNIYLFPIEGDKVVKFCISTEEMSVCEELTAVLFHWQTKDYRVMALKSDDHAITFLVGEDRKLYRYSPYSHKLESACFILDDDAFWYQWLLEYKKHLSEKVNKSDIPISEKSMSIEELIIGIKEINKTFSGDRSIGMDIFSVLQKL